MRFKARLLREHLQVLIGVSQACEKIGKRASIFLDDEFMRIAVVSDADAPRVFTEIKCAVVFSDYRIQSQSQNQVRKQTPVSTNQSPQTTIVLS